MTDRPHYKPKTQANAKGQQGHWITWEGRHIFLRGARKVAGKERSRQAASGAKPFAMAGAAGAGAAAAGTYRAAARQGDRVAVLGRAKERATSEQRDAARFAATGGRAMGGRSSTVVVAAPGGRTMYAGMLRKAREAERAGKVVRGIDRQGKQYDSGSKVLGRAREHVREARAARQQQQAAPAPAATPVKPKTPAEARAARLMRDEKVGASVRMVRGEVNPEQVQRVRDILVRNARSRLADSRAEREAAKPRNEHVPARGQMSFLDSPAATPSLKEQAAIARAKKGTREERLNKLSARADARYREVLPLATIEQARKWQAAGDTNAAKRAQSLIRTRGKRSVDLAYAVEGARARAAKKS